MKIPLTKKQYLLFKYIEKYINKNGYAPLYTEICDKFKRSKSTISVLVGILVTKGYLKKYNKMARGMQLFTKSSK